MILPYLLYDIRLNLILCKKYILFYLYIVIAAINFFF